MSRIRTIQACNFNSHDGNEYHLLVLVFKLAMTNPDFKVISSRTNADDDHYITVISNGIVEIEAESSGDDHIYKYRESKK